ncbi:MAG: hypothetical protein C0478_06060 [Planctomyces sp.]|nr:hypothetical protein [Planctomyces sp.]
MTQTVTWLHLSDLHACQPKTGWDARRLRETLLKDLRKLHQEEGLQPDLIFFTGDAAYGHLGNEEGKSITDQFREAEDFLTHVRTVFSKEIPKRQIFWVPGNHDVNKTRISDMETSWITGCSSLEKIENAIHERGRVWRLIMERLLDYHNALKTYGYDHLISDPDRLIYGDLREIHGYRIGIGGFNSAWSSQGIGREEAGRLWMAGRYQLETVRAIFPPNIDFHIGLIHHPANWLVPEEAQSFFHDLKRDYDFVLHGHEHQLFVEQDRTNGHVVLSAGACHEWSNGKNNGYNFVRLNIEEGRGEAWLRQYESTGGGWCPRIISGRTDQRGIHQLDLNTLRERLRHSSPITARTPIPFSTYTPDITEPLSFSVAEDYERRYRQSVVNRLDHMQLFGIDISRDSKEYSLSVAFVSVNVADELQEEAEEANTTDEEIDDSPTSMPVETFFNQLSGENKRLLFRGAAGSGKTTLLRWAAVQTGKELSVSLNLDRLPSQSKPAEDEASHLQKATWKERVPFLIRLRDYPHGELPRPNEYPLLLAKELPDAPLNWVTDLLQQGRALLMFDGVDEVPSAKRDAVLREIKQLLKTYPENAYIVTTRPEAVERQYFQTLGFSPGRVESLTQDGRNELIDRWHAAMESHLQQIDAAADLRPLAERLKRRLEESPAISRLTINPLLCAAVCALHRDREENLPETPVALCEKLVEMLLNRRDRERPGSREAQSSEEPAYRQLNYGQRKGLLARLAYHMVHSEQSTINEIEAQELVREGLCGYHTADLRSEPILQMLKERSGLLQESDAHTIEFLHNTLKDYLAAERFVNLNDTDILAQHADEESWQTVILFAVAFPREGSDFTLRLIRSLRDCTTLQIQGGKRNHQEKLTTRLERQRQFFFIRCCAAAHQLDDDEIKQQVEALKKALIPPRTLSDAEVLAACGEAIIPDLEYRHSINAIQRAACVRTLRIIGGDRAKRAIGKYHGDPTVTVQKELAQILDPLTLSHVSQHFSAFGKWPDWVPVERRTNINLLSTLKNLTRLDLSGSQVNDLTPLSHLHSLISLDLSVTSVYDISQLRDLTTLQSVELGYNPISDITPLRNLNNIQDLGLSNTEVSDLSPLRGLIKIKYLNIRGTGVRDLSPISSLTHLENTDLSAIPFNLDLSPLHNLKKLQTLQLQNTEVNNLSPLENLTSIKELFLQNTSTEDLTPISRLHKLKTLRVDNTQVRDAAPLSKLINIASLGLSKTRITDLSPLRDLLQLESLSINNTTINNLDPLSRLTNLKTLQLQNTQIVDLTPLSGLENLERLDLGNTPVLDIGPLSHLSNLRTLHIQNTLVTDLTPLSHLPNLQVISIGNINISDTSLLSRFRPINTIFCYTLGGGITTIQATD